MGPVLEWSTTQTQNRSELCPGKQGYLKHRAEKFSFKNHTRVYTSGRTSKASFPKLYDKFWKYSTQMLLPAPYLQCVIRATTPNLHRTQHEGHSSLAPHLNTGLWKIQLKEKVPGEMPAPKTTEVSTWTATELRRVWNKSLNCKGKAPFRLRGREQEHLRQLSSEICPFIRSQKCIKVL